MLKTLMATFVDGIADGRESYIEPTPVFSIVEHSLGVSVFYDYEWDHVDAVGRAVYVYVGHRTLGPDVRGCATRARAKTCDFSARRSRLLSDSA